MARLSQQMSLTGKIDIDRLFKLTNDKNRDKAKKKLQQPPPPTSPQVSFFQGFYLFILKKAPLLLTFTAVVK